MSALATSNDIRGIVAAVLSERFPKIRVVSINIRDNRDEDGDQEVEINVVFEAGKKDFDPTAVPAFVSAVIQKLNDAEESRFPVFSFIAKSDLGNRKPEAA